MCFADGLEDVEKWLRLVEGHFHSIIVAVQTFHERPVPWRTAELGDEIHQAGYADIGGGGRHEDRQNGLLQESLMKGRPQFFLGESAFLEKLLEQAVI